MINPIDIIVLGALYASVLIFVGCIVVMGYATLSCRLPSTCMTPRPASGYKAPEQHEPEDGRTLTDESYR